LELPATPLGDYRAILLAGVGSLSPDTTSALRRFVEAGGALLIFAGDAITADNYNQTLGSAGLLPGAIVARVDAPAGDPGFLFDYDSARLHPMLGAFRNYTRTGLEAVRAFSYLRTQLSSTVTNVERILSFASGDPAITLHRVGNGRVVFFAFGADAEWSTLVARPAFVTLAHELLANSLGGSDDWLNLEVGRLFSIPSRIPLTGAPALIAPDQSPVALERNATTNLWSSGPLLQAGMYKLNVGSRSYPIAVNPPASEADITPIGSGAIATTLGGIDIVVHGDSVEPLDPTRADAPDYGRTLLMILLPIVIVEMLLAWKFGRSRA
jgi:hypothetical protein